jgi:hypothetical protein
MDSGSPPKKRDEKAWTTLRDLGITPEETDGLAQTAKFNTFETVGL